VLGIIGVLNDEQGNVIALDGELVDQGVYLIWDTVMVETTVTLCQIKTSSPTPLTLRSSSNKPETAGTCEDFRRVLKPWRESLAPRF
jgi:hypothetical protein